MQINAINFAMNQDVVDIDRFPFVKNNFTCWLKNKAAPLD